ncbi:phosphatidylglycerol/phosphatidylinositol transfer protein [Anaeramoeba flamelloides]|uniref:Phosphatidylglycerol/phosphatidylinositol transfer protein n=1 Tax=Anaeramoeba flamelloides TaxID=1746091 RepID=A0ABQ8Y2Y6_9EUKA|nr:phosphatidylglycerol/phosphatidylinositol transfer protein [Anaeramoeba flamelloides]
MMKLKLAIVLCVFFVCCASKEWWFCESNKHYEFDVSSVTLKPNPPKIGDNLNYIISGSLSRQVTDGTLNLQTYFNNMLIFNITENLCSDPDNFPCPSGPGLTTLKNSFSIPSFIPPGNYTGLINLKDQDKKEILCLNYAMNLQK